MAVYEDKYEDIILVTREPPRQRYDNFKPFKTFGENRGGLWAWPKS